MLSRLSYVWFFVIPWTVAHQTPLSMGFSRQKIVEWVAISSSRGSFRPRDGTQVSHAFCIGRQVLYHQVEFAYNFQYTLNQIQITYNT